MIQIKELGYAYGANIVLQNITTELEPGKIYGLLGENGVGKTTLLTLLSGLKKPMKGSIEADGKTPYDRSPLFLQDLCYLPDEVSAPNTKAITFAKSKGEFYPNFDAALFGELMKEFEVNPEQKMNHMSSGQLKKTHICFALACKARYIFMDEPTNALDIPSKTQFRKALLKYTLEDSIIVISTHQVRDLENIIDPIIILDRQDVLLNASLEEIASKIYFDYGTTVRPEALYTEALPGSLIQVCINRDGEESKVNLEALFNTVLGHKELIKDLFRK